MVRAQLSSAVEDCGIALWREAVFVRVAGDGGDAWEFEVEGFGWEAGAGEARDKEGAEAAVDVEREALADCEA